MKILLNFLLAGLLMATTQTAPGGYTYIGNNDFRGYVAANAPQYLGYVGNDGGINTSKLGTDLANQGYDYGQDQWLQAGQKAVNNINNLYSQFQQAQGSVLGASTTVSDPATAAYYQNAADSLQKQVGQLDPQQAIGLQNIGNSYNLQANRLDQQKATAQRDYNTGVQQNTQSYLNNRNGIMQNTRANANALQRLLGINGSGNSSAAYEQAPYAAALQGSTQLNDAQQTFGNNQSSLDTNWQDTQRGYTNAFEDLNNQRFQQQNALKQSIAQTRASLLDQIGQARAQELVARGSGFGAAQAARAPYQSQIDSLLSQITNLSNQYANPVLRTADVSYSTPNMANWYLNTNQGQAAKNSSGGAASDLNPTFLGVLTGQQQRDKYGNIISA